MANARWATATASDTTEKFKGQELLNNPTSPVAGRRSFSMLLFVSKITAGRDTGKESTQPRAARKSTMVLLYS